MWGATLPLSFGALAGGTLQVFVQRTGDGPDARRATDAREAPLLGVASGQYLMVAGGSEPAQRSTTGRGRFRFGYQSLASPPTFPRAAVSFAVASAYALAIDEQGELREPCRQHVRRSRGAAGELVCGRGRRGHGRKSRRHGVRRRRATRTTSPSSRVLTIDANGSLAFYSLTTARMGAGAAYVAGRGLVVFGGDANAPALEVLAPGATTAITVRSRRAR